MKKACLLVLALALVLSIGLSACSAMDGAYSTGSRHSGSEYSYREGETDYDSSLSTDVEGGPGGKLPDAGSTNPIPTPGVDVPPLALDAEGLIKSISGRGAALEDDYRSGEERGNGHLLTAKVSDDNKYYSAWLKDMQNLRIFGSQLNFSLMSLERIRVLVYDTSVTPSEEVKPSPVIGAQVAALDAQGQKIASGYTGADGLCYLFVSDYTQVASLEATLAGTEWTETYAFEAPLDADTHSVDVAIDADVEPTPTKDWIELMFVIDATGSMGDEMRFIAKEISGVIERVVKHTNARINLALLFYRDDGDDVKFRYSDFVEVTEAAGLTQQLNILNEERATGGGDYPEALDEALDIAIGKQWAGGTKLIFHVYDAPLHSKQAKVDTYNNALIEAGKKGIKICPILASGADDLCEYLARQSALYTGGSSVFITNDSGIGGSHHVPDMPNNPVEYLDDALVRLIIGYNTGVMPTPITWDGKVVEDPTDGHMIQIEDIKDHIDDGTIEYEYPRPDEEGIDGTEPIDGDGEGETESAE